MIPQTLLEIKRKIEKTDSVKDENKKELLRLLSVLQSEIEQLSGTHGDQAESILGFTRASAHEATRKDKNPRLFKLAIDGLAASVQGFENSHPRLVELINSISNSLSNLGI